MATANEKVWDGKERREELKLKDLGVRSDDNDKLNDSVRSAYEERLKWEMSELYGELQATQKTKFFVINFSVSIFPIIVSVIVAIYSYYGETKNGEINFEMITGFFILILMAAGSSNMVVIKYIAALKSNAMLVMRQITCLRHALDSITFQQIQKTLPRKTEALRNDKTSYWHVFGRHRKLPIGNDGFRDHFVFNNYESADMVIMTYLFLLSSLLLLSPSMYLTYKGYEEIIQLGILAPSDKEIFAVLFFMVLIGAYFYIRDFVPDKIDHISKVTIGEDHRKVFSLNIRTSFLVCILLIMPILVYMSLLAIGIRLSEGGFISLVCIMSVLGISLICLSFAIVYVDSIRRILTSATSRQAEQSNQADSRQADSNQEHKLKQLQINILKICKNLIFRKNNPKV